MDPIIPPNISPTSGTNITLRCRIFRTIARKIMLARKVKRNADNILSVMPVSGVKIRKISSPIFAASSVPAVVGDTNLFCVICCMIMPEMLMPTPARISAAVRGTRLMAIREAERSPTPTKRETNARVSKTIVRISALKQPPSL